ncbi:MAG: cobalamin biosynthesis protein CbiD [Clostridium sp.]|nr:cobalamin biosynthesis protein CbiD [Clostridium sp.]
MVEEIKNEIIGENYVYRNNKKLMFGYTTGSCAAAASKAASIMLLNDTTIKFVELMTPKGLLLRLQVLEVERNKDYVKCAIKKYSGDDPDVTNGILVYSTVSKTKDKEIVIDGGIGVGRVTKEGLQCKMEEAAINKVPRSMIYNEVKKVCEDNDYVEGLKVVISIPEGVEIAKKTFNPRLGIVGGISVLGTSGIVEPMSEAALIETIKIEIKQYAANNKENLIITPGNYGEDFLKENMNIDISTSLKCSNYFGETLDFCKEFNMKNVLFIGHIGKLVKLAGGIMNTHSKVADARMEIMTAYAAIAGADISVLRRLINAITTDEALDILEENNLKEKTMELIMERINFQLKHRVKDEYKVGAIMFSNKHGVLGETEDVKEILEKFQN